MRDISKEVVERYADSLRERDAVSTAQNKLSAVNVVMEHAREGGWDRVSPRELAGASRSEVRQEAPGSYDRASHNQAVVSMREQGQERGAAVAELSRELGMRSEEAAKADLDRLRTEARSGAVEVRDGTKGGRGSPTDTPRQVPVSTQGRAAIERAAAARPEGSRNLLDPKESYREARDGWIRKGREAYAAATGGRGYHDARAAYACARYQSLTAHQAPVVAGARQADRGTDHQARAIIARELGHGRPDVAASYVGSAA